MQGRNGGAFGRGRARCVAPACGRPDGPPCEAGSGRRVVIFDPTCRGGRLRLGLSHAWRVGTGLYRGLGRIDEAIAADRWDTALRAVADAADDRPIAELQVWSHGKWGLVRLGDDVFDRSWLVRSHPHFGLVCAVLERLAPDGRVWFRTCETAGAARGQAFVQALADLAGVSVYAHTFVIGVWQSGLRRARPGGRPDWSPWEGLCEGTPDDPRRAFGSGPLRPSTVHFLSGEPVPLA